MVIEIQDIVMFMFCRLKVRFFAVLYIAWRRMFMNFELDSGNFELRVHDKTRFTTAS
jgi:hypothetical protein